MTNKTENKEVSYEVEETEEELFKLDFDSKKAYTLDDFMLMKKASMTNSEADMNKLKNLVVKNTENVKTSLHLPPSNHSFENELSGLMLNTFVSKAIASLLAKHRCLDTELDLLLENKRMGELKDMLDEEIDMIMEKRRRELKACYVGDKVRYEAIPEWAKSYVKEYMKDMIGAMSLLIDDSGK